MENGKIRIAIYSRKSRYSDKGDSVGNQIELAKEYIALHYPSDIYDVEIVVYEDEGFSGGSFNRPKFKEFLEEERKRPFNVLICYRLDRISRNIADFSGLINELTKLETSFISIKEQFDTTTPMGRAMMYIASVFAQLEREVITERVRDNLLELSKTGIWLGGDAPLGFSTEKIKRVSVCEQDENTIAKRNKTSTRLVINENEIDVLKLIFKKYLELKSLTQLETYLMNANIKTRKGKYYSVFSLKWILTNPVYVKNTKDIVDYYESKGVNVYAEEDDRKEFNGKYGFLTFNKTINGKDADMKDWIVAVGLHPGIISSDDWIAVQILLEKNSCKRYRAAGHPQKQTIVTGLLKCKACGSFMRPRNIDKRRLDGTVNYRYGCNLKEKSRGMKCKGKNVPGEALDKKILEILKETFLPNSLIYNELKNMSQMKPTKIVDDELHILDNEYIKNQEEIDKVINKMKYVDIDLMDMINNTLRDLKKRQIELKNQIDQLRKSRVNENESLEIKTAKDILKIIDNSFDIFDTFDLKTKRDIAKLFIESIYGNGDTIEINFLNTKLDETIKKNLIPITNLNTNFLSSDLPAEGKSEIAFKK